MLLNSKYSNFLFTFPIDFFPKEIKEKYKIVFNRNNVIFTNLENYVNYTIQSVSWPAITLETVQQEFQNVIKTYKGGREAERYIDRSIEVTFKTTDSYLNYFIMQDTLFHYWKLGETNKMFLPDLTLQVLDHYGYRIVTLLLRDTVFSGLSALELSYSSNIPEFRTFTASFNFKIIDYVTEES